MRRFDKKNNIHKVNLIVEQRYLESKSLIKEGNDLSPKEQEVYNDIISEIDVLNEGNFSSVLDKVKGYVSKGMLTAGILAALLATPGITNAQSEAIKDTANIEQTDTASSVEIQIIGKSMDANISMKKAKDNAKKLAHMLQGKGTSYNIVDITKTVLDGDTITKVNIEIKLTRNQLQSLEKVINQYDSEPFSIVSK